MYELLLTMEFATWYVGMKKDRRVKASLNRRLERVKNGLLGDVDDQGHICIGVAVIDLLQRVAHTGL